MTASLFPTRVLIVDDVPAVREALRWVFEDTPDLTVVGEADNGETAVTQAASLTPDVVILDIELPRANGYTVAQKLKALAQPPLVVFLTIHGDKASRRQAQRAGGDAFVEKAAGWPALLAKIRQLLNNQS